MQAMWTVVWLAPLLVTFLAFYFKPLVFLMKDEQLLLETPQSREVHNGPGRVFYVPFLHKATKRAAILLDEMEYVVVTESLTGVQRSEVGPKLLFQGAYETIGEKQKKLILKPDEYVKVLDSLIGEVRIVRGPKVMVPAPTETLPGGKQMAASLKRHEYVRLTDVVTGEMRVEKGEQLVVPKAMEHMEQKKSAVDVDLETAVLVASKETGQQRLVTEKGLFFPGAYDEIIEVRKLIRVEPHETAIVVDQHGTYTFYNGSAASSDKGTAFFLQPHCSLVSMEWSTMSPMEYSGDSAVRRQRRVATKNSVKKIDLRSKYLFFDYNVRTSDNVELVLEGTIFWQVVDPEQMIKSTGDPQGDVWYHCRSSLIAAVSRAPLEAFMTDFNTIVNAAAQTDSTFYQTRGVVVHSLEVTRYECADKKTSTVLQEIIQETTNRINRLQQQHSENEVSREKMAGEIEIEKQRTALIQAKAENDRMLATSAGESDGLKLAKNADVFLKTLGEAIPNNSDRINLLRFFGEQNAATQQAEHLASGHAHLFLTPQDMNLKLKVHSNGDNNSIGSEFEKP